MPVADRRLALCFCLVVVLAATAARADDGYVQLPSSATLETNAAYQPPLLAEPQAPEPAEVAAVETTPVEAAPAHTLEAPTETPTQVAAASDTVDDTLPPEAMAPSMFTNKPEVRAITPRAEEKALDPRPGMAPAITPVASREQTLQPPVAQPEQPARTVAANPMPPAQTEPVTVTTAAPVAHEPTMADIMPVTPPERATPKSELARAWSQQVEILETENQILRQKLRIQQNDPLKDIKVDAVSQIHENVLRDRVAELEKEVDRLQMRNSDTPQTLPSKTGGKL